MPRREEDFSGRRLMQAATRRSPVHRQMAADSKFAPAPVAGRQHGVWRLLRDDALRQFPRAFPDNFPDPTRPARPQRGAIARTLHLAGDAVAAHFGLNATALRPRQPQHETKQRRDEEDECLDSAHNLFHGESVAGSLACFFHGMARWGSRLLDLFPNQAKAYVFWNLYPCPTPALPHGGGSRSAADSNNCCRITYGWL